MAKYGLAAMEMGGKGAESLAMIIAILFQARTYTHMAHLKTSSFSAHKALNDFYDNVVELADDLAEIGQGKFGKLDIPYVNMIGKVTDPVGGLQMQMKQMDKLAEDCEHPALENVYQEVQALYLKTIYLLSELS